VDVDVSVSGPAALLSARFAYRCRNILAGAKFDYVQVLNCREMALFAAVGVAPGPEH